VGKKLGSELSQELRESLENPIVFNVSGADPGHSYELEKMKNSGCMAANPPRY
jgi:hypothetical protein